LRSHFADVEDLVSAVREAVPDKKLPKPPIPSRSDELYRGRRMFWISDSLNHVVSVPVANVMFSERLRWNVVKTANFIAYFRIGGRFVRVPAAMVRRITEEDVAETQRLATLKVLERTTGMIEPWSGHEVGRYCAQIVEGNHRTLAAMSVNEPDVFVYVSENTRANILPGDWARPTSKP
jgi:hypothetical protein